MQAYLDEVPGDYGPALHVQLPPEVLGELPGQALAAPHPVPRALQAARQPLLRLVGGGAAPALGGYTNYRGLLRRLVDIPR